MIEKELYDKTMKFLIDLKSSSNVEESDYQKILEILCDKILQQDLEKIRLEIISATESKEKCSSCGELLEDWENELCGPCKINDTRFKDIEED